MKYILLTILVSLTVTLYSHPPDATGRDQFCHYIEFNSNVPIQECPFCQGEAKMFKLKTFEGIFNVIKCQGDCKFELTNHHKQNTVGYWNSRQFENNISYIKRK